MAGASISRGARSDRQSGNFDFVMQILWRDEMLGLSKSARRARWAAALATACLLCSAGAARALVIAGDDASQSAYIDGWQNGDNGGSGFNAWTNIGNQSGSGSGGGFLA